MLSGIKLTSGIGQFHTDEPDKDNRKKYLAIGIDEIRALVNKPQSVTKAQAQWLIPSTLPSRNFKEQEGNGQYLALWADLDKEPPTLSGLAERLAIIINGADFECYNSRSATEENQKARVLVFLDKSLPYAEWTLAQEILNDKLEALGIVPDRASQRAAQLCYLPNKGTLYSSQSKREGVFFNPLTVWVDDIAAKQQKLDAERIALEALQHNTMAKKSALKLSDAPDLIGAFNLAYTPQEWLLTAGYAQRGNSFRHPRSESGSYSATVKDGRVNALSPSDPLYNNGAGAHDAFSTYETLFHGGDRVAALKSAGDDLLAIGCVSWNKAQQIAFAKIKADAGNFANDDQQQNKSANPANPANYEPEPLRAPLPKAKAYPVDALGDILGKAANALHETIKAPLTLCCQSVLASSSLAAQAHYDVVLPWGEKKPLSLYLLTVAESGERKSGVDDVVLGVAKAQERQQMELYTSEQEKYTNDLVKYEAANKDANRKPSKPKNQAASDYAAAAQHEAGNKPEAPIMPLRFVSEPTVEGLYKLMAIGQPSIGLFSDEAGLLIGGYALNSDNALKTMARWCKLWDGAAFDRVRGGDGSGVLYGRRLAMHQLAQPDVMAQLLGDRMANGQGLLARCLVAWPESTIGIRHITSFEQPRARPEVKKLFAKLKLLTEAEPRTGKAKQELDPVELPLSDDAKKLAMEAMNNFETLMQRGNDLSELKDRTSKALENACRIAGVLTVVEEGLSARIINVDRLSRALIIIQWYLAETLRIRGAAVVPQSVSDAESLSNWLQDRGYKAFRTTPILTTGPSQLRNKKRLDGAIEELVDNGYIQPNEPGTIVDGVATRKSWSVLYVA